MVGNWRDRLKRGNKKSRWRARGMSGKMDKDEWKSKKRGYENLFCRFALLCCDLSGFAVLDWMSVSGEYGQRWRFKQHQRSARIYSCDA